MKITLMNGVKAPVLFYSIQEVLILTTSATGGFIHTDLGEVLILPDRYQNDMEICQRLADIAYMAELLPNDDPALYEERESFKNLSYKEMVDRAVTEMLERGIEDGKAFIRRLMDGNFERRKIATVTTSARRKAAKLHNCVKE